MKKIILSCALVLASGAVFAQQSNLNRADAALQKATTDPKNVDYTQIDAAWGFIQLAMEHEKTSVDPVTWDKAALIQSHYMQKMLNDRNVTGELDEKKFFENQKLIVEYYLKCDDLEHTPNKKGKLPKEVYRPINAIKVKGVRQNLRNAGGMLAESDPDLSIMYINYYNSTATHPIFTGMTDIADPDSIAGDIGYYLAKAYMTKKDTVNALPAFEKSLASKDYGKYACGEIVMILEKQGKKDEQLKFIEIGYERYPELAQYGNWLLIDKLNKKEWDAALKLCDELIARFPQDMFAYSNKGTVLCELKKFDEAVANFVTASENVGDSAEPLSKAAVACMMKASQNADKADVSKAAYQQAIDFLERVKAEAPEQTDLYGANLYVCYSNIGQPAKAKPYEKYYDK